MTSYVIRRIIGTIPIVIGISLVVFFIMRMLPGDVALSILGGDEVTNIDPEAVATLRQQLGLDVPIWQQYPTWAGNLLQFDAGTSLWSGKPVFAEIGQRLPLIIELAVLALVISLLLAVPMGIFAAAVQDTPFDYAVRGFTVLGLAVPAFFLGSVMLLVLTLGLNWAPPLGYVPLTRNPLVNLQQMFWPALVLGFANAALITRLTRSTMLEVLREGYVRTAKAKGLSDWTILAGHAFRNAVIPVITLSAIELGGLLGGTVVMETIFTLPGMGRYLVDAIHHRDYPVIQTILLLVSVVYVLLNLLVDILYVALDPRIKFE